MRLHDADMALEYTRQADIAVRHVTSQLMQVLPSRPDLLVLPEVCDRPRNLPDNEIEKYYAACGPKLLDLFCSMAEKYGSNIAYTAPRETPDGIWTTSTRLIGRNGRIAGICDINASEVSFLNCDFGRIGCIISSDLLSEGRLNKYMKEKPELIIFPSSFYGGFLQQYWAYSCNAYLASAVGNPTNYIIPSNIISPGGDITASSTNYSRFATKTLNLDFIVAHGDCLEDHYEILREKYCDSISLYDPGRGGTYVLSSEIEGVSMRDMAKELGIEEDDHFLERFLKRREEYISSTNK
jgi:predicted amidohydrolase